MSYQDRKSEVEPKLTLNKEREVVNAGSGVAVPGTVVFDARSTSAMTYESPISAMQRWSEFRQSRAKESAK
jgi:hypothetical protein